MPVYLRKDEGEPSLQTPSISEFKLKDEDFVLDPEILFDYLPQPYRMIDKMVELVFDVAWEQIEGIEAEKARKAAQRSIPVYSNPTDIPNCHDVRCMCASSDKNASWLYAGTFDDKLTIFDSKSHEVLMEWSDEPVQFKKLKVASLMESVQVVLAEDESELCRLFITALDKIHFVKVLNETDSFQAKVGCVRTWLSPDATALALYLKNTTTGQQYIEVFKCPVDAWTKELDAANQQYQKQLNSAVDVVTVSVPSISFTKPVSVLRVKPPQFPQGVATTPYEMFRRAESVVPGSGLLAHQLSLTHMEVANTAFNMLNANNLHLLPPALSNKQGTGTATVGEVPGAALFSEREPEVLFFTPGRLTPIGIDNEKENGRVCSVGVWWSELYYMSIYSILRQPAKDMEHKPDSIMNFGGPLHCSTMSSDNVLLAFGFSDGTIVVYDKEYGSAQQVMKANFSDTSVKLMQFVQPSLFASAISAAKPESSEAPLLSELESEMESLNSSRLLASLGDGGKSRGRQKAPPAKTNGILALSEDGTLSLCTFRSLFMSEVSFLCARDSFEQLTTGVASFSLVSAELPQLVSVVYKQSGTITLFDMLKCQSVCSLQLPPSHQLLSPLSQPTLVADGQGEGEGQGEEIAEDSSLETPYMATLNTAHFMFVHGSCSIPMKKHSDEADGDGEGEDGGAATAGDKEGGGEQGGAVKPTSRENSTAAESTKSKSSSKLTSKDETTDENAEQDREDEGEEEEESVYYETHRDIFSFPLRSLPSLDCYWEEKRRTTDHISTQQLNSVSILSTGKEEQNMGLNRHHGNSCSHVDRIGLEQLCRSNFSNRIVDQTGSIERLRKRWGQLGQDVKKVRDIRFNKGPSRASNLTRTNTRSAKN